MYKNILEIVQNWKSGKESAEASMIEIYSILQAHKGIVGFKRISDGEIYSINEDGTFSSAKMKIAFPTSLNNKYTAERLSDSTYFEPMYKYE